MDWLDVHNFYYYVFVCCLCVCWVVCRVCRCFLSMSSCTRMYRVVILILCPQVWCTVTEMIYFTVVVQYDARHRLLSCTSVHCCFGCFAFADVLFLFLPYLFVCFLWFCLWYNTDQPFDLEYVFVVKFRRPAVSTLVRCMTLFRSRGY